MDLEGAYAAASREVQRRLQLPEQLSLSLEALQADVSARLEDAEQELSRALLGQLKSQQVQTKLLSSTMETLTATTGGNQVHRGTTFLPSNNGAPTTQKLHFCRPSLVKSYLSSH